MRKIIASLAFLFASFSLFAQNETPAPGLYAVSGDSYQSLPYTNASVGNKSFNIIGVEVGKKEYSYKDETSGVNSNGSFLLVVDPERKTITQSKKDYNPFIKSMTPDKIIIVPLEVEKGKRKYKEGSTVNGINTKSRDRVPFDWELVNDNTFKIETGALEPGEYAFVFKAAKLAGYEFSAIFGFTVPAAE